MREALALFRDAATRDELGLGNIRDAIADALFPGVSIIQTRLRYFLFIPWLFRELEDKASVHASQVRKHSRGSEISLIEALVEGSDGQGVIGRRSRAHLQRLPSSIYWLALREWGIFEPDWSLDEYYQKWSLLRDPTYRELQPDDRGIRAERFRTWHPLLPQPPCENWIKDAAFELTRGEAEFLKERVRVACRGSLLAHAVELEPSDRPTLEVGAPWETFHGVPPDLRATLRVARKFSSLMQGAALLYNVLLARKSEAYAERAAAHESSFRDWWTASAEESVTTWPLEELWAFCSTRVNVAVPTREFIVSWQRLAHEFGEETLNAPPAHQLIQERERRLKGARSRFVNPWALEKWGGSSGIGAMVFRWPTVRRMLADLYAGLDRRDALSARA